MKLENQEQEYGVSSIPDKRAQCRTPEIPASERIVSSSPSFETWGHVMMNKTNHKYNLDHAVTLAGLELRFTCVCSPPPPPSAGIRSLHHRTWPLLILLKSTSHFQLNVLGAMTMWPHMTVTLMHSISKMGARILTKADSESLLWNSVSFTYFVIMVLLNFCL